MDANKSRPRAQAQRWPGPADDVDDDAWIGRIDACCLSKVVSGPWRPTVHAPAALTRHACDFSRACRPPSRPC